MSRETRDKGRDQSAPAQQEQPSQKPAIAPGKVTLTMGMRHAGSVQRKAGPAPLPAWEGAMAASSPAKSSAALTDSVWMDAAHRGTMAFTERGLDPVQARGAPTAEEPASVHAAASAGVRGSGSALPHMERIQAAFGAHDLGDVQAHIGGAAANASERIGAEAYATGEHVAFRGAPDLHTAAHEAAHVVQQRAGVALAGGVGQASDAYEQHADAVADSPRTTRSATASACCSYESPAWPTPPASATPARCCTTCAASCAAVCRSGAPR